MDRTYLPELSIPAKERVEWRETDVGAWIGQITMIEEPEHFWIAQATDLTKVPGPDRPIRLCIMATDWLSANTARRRRIHTLGWHRTIEEAKAAALAHIEQVDAGGRP